MKLSWGLDDIVSKKPREPLRTEQLLVLQTTIYNIASSDVNPIFFKIKQFLVWNKNHWCYVDKFQKNCLADTFTQVAF